MQVLRRLVLLAFAIAVSACMPQKPFDPHDLPLPVPLQEPPAGKAVVYLLRAPHDDSTVVVYFDEKKIARLPPATYTVTVIDPGIYQVASSPSGRSDADPASSLTVKEGEIRFLYLSAATGSTAKFIAAPIRGAGFVPLLLPTYGASGAKTWKECTELDAQGFMSIAKPIAPEPGAA